jgi:Xaa-Pro aminopeptidase
VSGGTTRGGTSERLRRFRDHLRQREIPLALVFDPFNICYLTGYWTILSGIAGTEALLAVPERGEPWLAVPGLELTLAREQCPQIKDIRHLRPIQTTVHGQAVPAQTVPQLVRAAVGSVSGHVSVGLDISLLRTDKYQALGDALRGHQVADLTPDLAAMRASKDPAEQRAIRESSAVVSQAAAAISEALRPGVTENTLAAEAVRVIWASGGTITHLVVASGPRGALPHALPTARPVEAGEFVVVDIGVLRNNYWAEIARTYVAGGPTAEQTRLLALVQEAQNASRRALRSGVAARDVDAAARNVLRNAGYDDGTYTHTTGHGLGIMGPDAPVIGAHNAAPIPLHSTVTLEPGLYFPGSGGIRIEDSFLVTETGAECWTT